MMGNGTAGQRQPGEGGPTAPAELADFGPHHHRHHQLVVALSPLSDLFCLKKQSEGERVGRARRERERGPHPLPCCLEPGG